jgi:fructose-1,6-bisphosphatase I
VTDLIELGDYLRAAARGDALRQGAGRIVLAIAEAGREIGGLLATGTLAEHSVADRANAAVLGALRAAPVRAVSSAEADGTVALDAGAGLIVAVDPLDGSSNIDSNAPTGTIVSVLPMLNGATSDEAHFLQPGARQAAAGFVLYGAQTALALTLGDGTRLFTLDRASGRFLARREPLRIPPETREFAVNGSNWRHWDEPVRRYVTGCLMGAPGPRGVDFNMRWLGATVGEAFRILARGGIYLYPGDTRPGFEQGRLRLVHAANPVAFLIEQAGGAATNGRHRILGLAPRSLDQRIPFVFGSAREVERVRAAYEDDRGAMAHPLFGQRTLFRGGTGATFGVSAPCP